jgi:DNA-binding transcriptional ArsR family regulator
MPRPRASADVFQAVADPTRRAILDRLRGGNAPVTDLASGFAMSRPAISKHLRVLRQAGLVRERRAGRQRVYQLTPAPLEDVAQWAEAYRSFWQTNLASLKQYVEGQQASSEQTSSEQTSSPQTSSEQARDEQPQEESS